MKLTPTHRLLLWAYPSWFRQEFEVELAAHLARQREERRYTPPVFGPALFWWEAGTDALKTGVMLRAGRAREWWRRTWRGSADDDLGRISSNNSTGRNRGGVEAMLDSIARDVRQAMRGLIKNPGYAAVFVVTLGLGIGANTAMFSAVNGVLLRPLPHEDGDRLVYLRHTAPAGGIENVLFSVPEIQDYRTGFQSLESVAEFSAMNFTMLGHEEPRRVRAGIVTGNYFGVMGLGATLGRVVGPEDDGAAAAAVIVLSDGYWRRVFGGDPDIIGRTIEINGRTATFVGVAEPAPPYPERTDIYVNLAASPHHLSASMADDRAHRMTEVFARLSPGATVEAVRAETAVVTARIHAEYPDFYDAGTGYQVSVTPLKTQLTTRARPTLLLLLATSFFVFVIACANLANLTLTRVLRRDHELAIRVSLGGSRATLRRSLLVESLVLAVAGAALGLAIASMGVDLLVAFTERFTSRASEIALDGSVFGFAFLAAVVASIFFTLLPPLPSGDSLGGALTRSGTRTTIGSRARRVQRGLVVAQIGTSFVLLIGAGLLLRTMLHISQVDPGFETSQVLSLDIPADFTKGSADVRSQYLSMLDEVRGLPGVEGAAYTSAVPLTGTTGSFTTQMEIDVDGHEPVPGAPHPRADFRVVSPTYFSLMDIDVLQGREFTTTDVEGAQGVVVINEAMARAYFGDRNPIGQQIAWTDDVAQFMGLGMDFRTVVGVVADTRDAGLDADVVHTVYNPYQQITPYFTDKIVARISGDPTSLVPAIRDIVLSHDPNQPIVNVATIAALGEESVAPRRLNTILLGSFALLALVIAAVGIGGVLAFSVGSRRREFGVRSALGAARHQIWSGVLVEGAKLAALGVLIGIATAVLLTRFISGWLFGVPALDPITFVGVGMLLGFVAVGAAWLPAWRAASVSPMEAMAAE